jgi:hypothetical protein
MMDYDALLVQVLDLLQREQRVAYRILKRRLQLDDETLEDLKADLIYAKKLAMDEEGQVLVWTGETSTASPAPTRAEIRTELATASAMYQSMDTAFWLPQTKAALAQVEGQ